MTGPEHVVIFDENRERASAIGGLLARVTPGTESFRVLTFHDLRGGFEPASGLRELRSGLPILAIVVEADQSRVAFPDLLEAARQEGVPTLLVVDGSEDPTALAARVRGADGWLRVEAIEQELPARVAEILGRRGQPGGAMGRLPSLDSRFLALIVHDLRTPLNVIGLTIRAITQTMPDRSPEFDEDLLFLRENSAQIEKMLSQLGDFCRLIEGESRISAYEFDPRRFLADFVEAQRSKAGAGSAPVKLELGEGSPVEVCLDQNRVKLALQHALGNAINAAGKTPVRIRSTGTSDRWTVELIVDKPPPPNVVSRTLRADLFERLAGSPAERRGLDLAIAAHVSDLFGGTARLAVEPDQRTSIVLEWPQRLEIESPRGS